MPLLSPLRISAGLVLLASCGRSSPTLPPLSSSPSAPLALSAPRWVVLATPVDADGSATFLPVQVTGEPIGADAPIRVEAVATVGGGGTRTEAMATSDGREWLAVATETEGTWSAMLQPVDGSAPQVVPLPEPPAALHLVGRALFVGTATGVWWIDLQADALTPVRLISRELAHRKAYDLFASDGDLVIAIDDVVRPIYADSIQLDAAGVPSPLASFTLPGLINGSYHAAALHRTGPGEGTLFVLARYSVLDGTGQDLAALPVRHGQVSPLDHPLNNGSTSAVPVWEEHQDRGTGALSRLAWGDTLTPWTRLAVTVYEDAADRIAVAAGERGQLSFRPDLAADTTSGQCLSSVHPLPVTDVLARGNQLWTLAGDTLYVQHVSGITHTLERSIPLPPFGSWVHILR